MQTRLLYLFTRTPLHVGAGSSVGAIDQPIIRERHTGFPIIPGSAIKGVLADAAGATSDPKKQRTPDGREMFGSTQSDDGQAFAGGVSFGEGRILLFPVRSARGCFAWVTCPIALARWKSCGGAKSATSPVYCSGDEFWGDTGTLGEKAVLEDSLLVGRGTFPRDWAEALVALMTGLEPAWKDLVPKHLALLSNELFAHFVSTCCEVPQHIRLDDDTGVVAKGALFNQENVPAEAIFVASITELRAGVITKLSVPTVLQFGADATTGLGFCSTQLATI